MRCFMTWLFMFPPTILKGCNARTSGAGPEYPENISIFGRKAAGSP